ncbi:hypothetical protein EV191_101607 [Tamaricihabitans halophyticus]|uniref:Uncharacterized protein n=1 Tax=Tamaricihabitans halophyticus TaxID=1262583 RepID=A0A4R2R1U4_9PSEU|nr:hypothetical protein [Tamaricihabitans halophyticus]TCP56662.1 hypothetical protein EV191_101607 [Tamaricihabitans halophyticus]
MFVPWRDISAVVLFKQQAGMAKVPYIALHGPAPWQDPGAPRGEKLRKINATLIPQAPDAAVLASRAINGWKLDHGPLTAAIQENAPHVSLCVMK